MIAPAFQLFCPNKYIAHSNHKAFRGALNTEESDEQNYHITKKRTHAQRVGGGCCSFFVYNSAIV